jgi:hypothetical protein
MIPVWFTCVVLSGYFPCKVTIDSNLHDTLGYGVKLLRCCHSVEVVFHYVHMRFMVMINYDYLVVKNDDTKNG